MSFSMRRLHPRGPTNRGLQSMQVAPCWGQTVFWCGAPQWVTKPPARRRQPQSSRLCRHRRWDWLFDQCCHIAQALNDNEIALAQIYGVHAAPDDLDDQQVAKLADAAPLLKENFNPDEPRVPAGNPDGGQWTADDGASAEADRKSICIERCAHLLERPLTYRWSNVNTFAFYRCVNDCMSEAG